MASPSYSPAATASLRPGRETQRPLEELRRRLPDARLARLPGARADEAWPHDSACRVNHQDRAARPAQRDRAAQPGRATPDHDYVIALVDIIALVHKPYHRPSRAC